MKNKSKFTEELLINFFRCECFKLGLTYDRNIYTWKFERRKLRTDVRERPRWHDTVTYCRIQDEYFGRAYKAPA